METGRKLAVRMAVVLGVICLLACAAHAKTPDTAKVAEGYFTQAEQHFYADRYDEAIVGYQAAYRLAPYPDLLFNIGRAYQKKGDRAHAVDCYKKYVAIKPAGESAALARQHIAALEAQARSSGRTLNPLLLDTCKPPDSASVAVSVVVSQQQSEAPPKPTRRWWIAGVVGGVVVVAGVGGTLAGVMLSDPGQQSPYYGNVSPGFQEIQP